MRRPSEFPHLTTDRLLMRVPAAADVPAIVRFVTGNADFLKPWEPRRSPAYYSPANWQMQVHRFHDEFRHDQSLRLILTPRTEPDRIVGMVNFTGFMRGVAHFCFLGYSLAKAEQGKGYMTESLEAAIRYVFQELNMHRIMANYMPHNERSAGVLKRLGFQIEGYAKDYLLIDGAWRDHVLTARLNPDWQPE